MIGTAWLVTVFLVAAATVVAWPLRPGRTRRRAVLGPARSSAGRVRSATRAAGPRRGRGRSSTGPTTAPAVGGRYGGPLRAAERPTSARPPGRRDGRRPAGADRPAASALPGADQRPDDGGLPRAAAVSALLAAPPRRMVLLAGVAGGSIGGVTAGPVAAVALAGYGALGVRAVLRRRATGRTHRLRRQRLDQLCALAADLRAGLPVTVAAGGRGAGHEEGADRLGRLAGAAVRLADRTGAPLAELVERIEADARATDRGLAAAAAQAAGARATAWLLAALPLGGIGLGYGVGVDPVAVLLHTPVGGGCAVAAIALQIGGLLWAERLGGAPQRAG